MPLIKPRQIQGGAALSSVALTALAPLTPAADTAPYFTGPTAAALMTVTAVARTFLAAATQAAQRSAIGLGTAALLDSDTDGTLAANSDSKVATQKAIRTYIEARLAGLSWKQSVRAATTANGTLATAFENGDTIDGVTLVTGDRILLKNQTTPSENGIYTVNASGAPTRATDADTGAELLQATVYVQEGTANADTAWTCTTNATITPGSTALTFAQFGAGASYSADETTIHLAGSTFSIKAGGVGPTELASTAVTPGSYGNSGHVGAFTVDADGRLTSATSVAIAGSVGSSVPPWVSDSPHTEPGSPASTDDEYGGTGYPSETSLDTGATRFGGAAAWSRVNTGGMTDAVQGGSLVMTLPLAANAGDNVRGAVMSISGSSWKYRAYMSFYGDIGHTIFGGLWIRESGTGKLIIFGHRSLGDIRCVAYSNATTFVAYRAVYTNVSPMALAFGGFFEIELSGSNYIFRYSGPTDGAYYDPVLTQAKTTDFTTAADQIGICVNANGPGGRSVVVAPWIRKVA